MASLVKFVILLSAALAVSANPVDWVGLNTETVLLENLAAPAPGKNQSTTFGTCQPSDKLLFAESVNVKSGFFQVKKKDVAYPPDHSMNGGLISCIKVIDELLTGKNGVYKIGSGGVNVRFVIINMATERGEPMKYAVQIYGKQ